MDKDYQNIFEQLKGLPQLDRLTNLSLMWIGETLCLLLNSGDQTRLLSFKEAILKLFDEAQKAIVNASANSN